MKRQYDTLTEEERRKVIEDIIDFYATERDEEIGVIAANELLDIVLKTAGIFIYNHGAEDTKQFIRKRMSEAEFDIEATIKKSYK